MWRPTSSKKYSPLTSLTYSKLELVSAKTASWNCYSDSLANFAVRSGFRFFFVRTSQATCEFIPIQPIKGSVTLDRSSRAAYLMLAEGVWAASYMNATGFWSRQPYASQRSLHGIMHAMSWAQLGRAACAAFARTTTKGNQSFSPSTTTLLAWKRDQSHAESTTKERFVSPSTVKRSSSRPLDKSTSGVDPPNRTFLRAAKDIETLIT